MYINYTQDKSFARVLDKETTAHILNNVTPTWGTYAAVPYGTGNLITKTSDGHVWYIHSILP